MKMLEGPALSGTGSLEGRVLRGRSGGRQPIGLTEFGPPKPHFQEREPFMPPSDTPENEDAEPGGFQASSRWLSPPGADDTTGG
jgi:hypothetical protein